MLALKLLFLLTFFTTNISTVEFANTPENIHLSEFESGDKDTYESYKPYLNLPELSTERFSNQYIRLNPEVPFTIDLAKLAISNLKAFKVDFHFTKNGESVDLKLPSHFISFQFHSFP